MLTLLLLLSSSIALLGVHLEMCFYHSEMPGLVIGSCSLVPQTLKPEYLLAECCSHDTDLRFSSSHSHLPSGCSGGPMHDFFSKPVQSFFLAADLSVKPVCLNNRKPAPAFSGFCLRQIVSGLPNFSLEEYQTILLLI
jgi:hypothetical protein